MTRIVGEELIQHSYGREHRYVFLREEERIRQREPMLGTPQKVLIWFATCPICYVEFETISGDTEPPRVRRGCSEHTPWPLFRPEAVKRRERRDVWLAARRRGRKRRNA